MSNKHFGKYCDINHWGLAITYDRDPDVLCQTTIEIRFLCFGFWVQF